MPGEPGGVDRPGPVGEPGGEIEKIDRKDSWLTVALSRALGERGG